MTRYGCFFRESSSSSIDRRCRLDTLSPKVTTLLVGIAMFRVCSLEIDTCRRAENAYSHERRGATNTRIPGRTSRSRWARWSTSLHLDHHSSFASNRSHSVYKIVHSHNSTHVRVVEVFVEVRSNAHISFIFLFFFLLRIQRVARGNVYSSRVYLLNSRRQISELSISRTRSCIISLSVIGYRGVRHFLWQK